MKLYIGLDAHSQTSTLAVVNPDGDVLRVDQIETNERNLVSYLGRLKGQLILTFEESFLSKWLFAILKPQVDELIVCNPLYVTKRGDAKTDKLDAINLARELRAGNLVKVFHADQNALYELRTAVAAYGRQVKMIIQTKNRLKMLYRSEGIVFKTNEPYKNPELLEKLGAEPMRMVGQTFYQEIQFLEAVRKRYRAYFEHIARTQKQVFALTSVPGIQATSACIIAAYVCDPRRFPHKYCFWSYCGLVRHHQISDGTIYGSKKAHGRSQLKGIFHSAAMKVQVYHRTSALNEYFREKLQRGVDKRAARVALARKIASICLSVMKSEKAYMPDRPKTKKFSKDMKWINAV